MEIRTKKISLLIAAFLAAALLAGLGMNVAGSGRPYRALCEKLGGKWASVPSSCVTPLCYWTGTCGYWANPAARCALLKTNAHVSEVYFQLGEPDEVKGVRYVWHERKGRPIEAVIERERLTSLKCGDSTF
jgi:hypothetical protein